MDAQSEEIATVGLLPLRFGLGVVFIMHGGMKLFAMGLAGTTAMLGHVGIPLAVVAAPALIALELLGGVAILLGLLTRWVALLLACDMAVVILTVRLGGGFFIPHGFEFEFTLLCGLLTLAAVGPGGLSLDAVLRRRRVRS